MYTSLPEGIFWISIPDEQLSESGIATAFDEDISETEKNGGLCPPFLH